MFFGEVVAPGGRARGNRSVRAIRARASLALALVFAPMHAAHADLVVPSGGQSTTGGGQIDLGCTDVVVGGTLLVSSGGLVNVRHLTIQTGGTVDGGSGVIQLGGNWTNQGTFSAGTGTAQFRDLCSLASATIGGLLEITGTAPNPIQFRSGTPGQVAFINLVPAGAQQILHVGVTDVWATGQHLAPTLTNEGGGGNAFRWFRSSSPGADELAVPTLGDLATLALAALLAGFAIFDLRRRSRARARPTHVHRFTSRNRP